MSSRRVFGPLPVAVALATGIALARLVPGAPLVWWVIAAILAVMARRYPSAILAMALAAGIAIGRAPAPELPAGVTVDDRTVDRVVGVVTGPVVATAHGAGASLDTGDAAVWVWSETRAALRPGARVAVTGRLMTPRRPRGAAMPVLAGRQFELAAEHVEPLGDDPSLTGWAWRWADATAVRWSTAIDEAGGDRDARAALRGIVVGDRSAVPSELDARWRAVGIYHVLSVSGLHLAVVAGLAFALLRRLVAASPWGGRVRPARWAAPPALALAIGYTLVTGAQLATLRALIVITLVLVAGMLDRPIRLVDALGAAAIVVLLWRPDDLFDPSFQLSFTAALTLAMLAKPAEPGLRGVRAWIVRSITASAWVVLTTAPLTAYHFHEIHPGGIVGNLLLTPIVELIALPLALVGIALGPVGEPLIATATWIVSLVDGATELLAHGMLVGRVAIASAMTMAAVVALSLMLVRVHRPRLRLLGWVALCLAWSFGRMTLPPGALRVTFLDVGQGDAAMIELPDGGVWLIDAGGHANARDLHAATAPGRTIERFLAAAGRTQIDVAIISHPHPDHYLGLAGLRVPIGELWWASDLEPTPTVRNTRAFSTITAALAAHGTRIVHPALGGVVARAGVEVVVWAPRFQRAADEPMICASDPVRGVNDNSLVVEVRYRGRSILFTGDLEEEGEADAVAAGLGHVDVVKVAHHGSPTSSSHAFVVATRPSVAVISLGRANTFGFPSPEVVARWRAVGAEVARTDTDGAITVVVDASGGLTIDRFVHTAP